MTPPPPVQCMILKVLEDWYDLFDDIYKLLIFAQENLCINNNINNK